MSGKAMQRAWWINKPFIDREVEISQTELQCIGGNRGKGSLMGRSRSICQSMKA